MNKKKICFVGIVFLHLAGISFAQEGLVCETPVIDIKRIEALREAMAVIDLTVGPHDVATGIGLGVIDSSCITGQHSEYRDETIRSIRAAINRVIEQSTRCYETLRIIEMPSVISVLRRTRFQCEDPTGNGVVASMRRTSRTYDSCGNGTSRFMAGAHRRYGMTISAPSEVVIEKLNATASTRLATEDLASFFAHEAMHVLAMNNRDWHNDYDESERPLTGCSPSLFDDRIYFTQAACFPNSDIGQAFYAENGPHTCVDLCRRALTEVDEATRVNYDASTEPGAEHTTAFGPSQVARPYPEAEVQRICERIRSGFRDS